MKNLKIIVMLNESPLGGIARLSYGKSDCGFGHRAGQLWYDLTAHSCPCLICKSYYKLILVRDDFSLGIDGCAMGDLNRNWLSNCQETAPKPSIIPRSAPESPTDCRLASDESPRSADDARLRALNTLEDLRKSVDLRARENLCRS